MYAAGGIPQYVVVDLQHDRVLVHTLPVGNAYQSVVEIAPGATLFVNAGTRTVGIAIDRLLP